MVIITMNKAAIKHIPKSSMAYAIDSTHLHIYLQSAINDLTSVELIIADPFDYDVIDTIYYWKGKTNPFLKMNKAYNNELLDYHFLEVEALSRRRKYAFILRSSDKVYFYGSSGISEIEENDILNKTKNIFTLSNYFNFPYINDEDIIDSPKWSYNTIWYQIFPERFNKSAHSKGDYLAWGSVKENVSNKMIFGGDIKGIIEKIPYLVDLGISGIYFTPIFEADSTHKYDTINYFKIDPQFGTNEDFKLLVETCHENNIKIMLDAVFNHSGFFHPFFQDVIKNKKNSIYYNSFYIEDDNFVDFEFNKDGYPIVPKGYLPKYRTFATTLFMPKLNTSDPIMEKYLLEVASYWVKEFDIDGWRLDVSNEVSHSFWRKFRTTVRSIKPDIYILGENWDDSNAWLKGDQLDAVMNYELAYPIWQFFGSGEFDRKISSEKFSYLINDLIVRYQKNVAIHMFNLIDSHDTMRLLTRFGRNKKTFMLAYLFMFTFCGSPAIYYGDEIGLEGHHDPDCRRCMIWDETDQDLELKTFFKDLIKIRKNNSDFTLVDIKWINNKDNLLVYQKNETIIIINNNNEPREFELNQKLINLENNVEEHISKLLIESYGYSIFKIV
jgi:glycosidase